MCTTAAGSEEPCHCVLRKVFRVCYRRFRDCAAAEYETRMSIEKGAQIERTVWGRKEQEYLADFCLTAKRVLSEEDHKIFRFRFLLGADYRLCCRRLNIDRGTFFRAIYRIERNLGRELSEMKPYPLYPLEDYFAGPRREHRATVVSIRPDDDRPKRPVPVPFRRAA
jgi:hypothetical protein